MILAFLPGIMRDRPVGSTRYHLWTLAKMGVPVLTIDPPLKIRNTDNVRQLDGLPFTACTAARTPPFAVSRTITGLEDFHREQTSNQLWKSAMNICKQQNLKPEIVWLGAPWHSILATKAKDAGLKTIHHVYDELADSSYLRPHQQKVLRKWETKLLDQTDLLLCSSLPQLQNRFFHSNAHLLENAVSDDFLNDNFPEPQSCSALRHLKQATRPRFVYGGVADHRCNPAFFRSIVENDPCGSLTFLGNKGVNVHPELEKLIQENPKVHLAGRIEYDDYPALYQEADVCLLGHINDPFTRVMYPEKIIEYLSSGLPIISVPLPEVRRIADQSDTSDLIYFCNNRTELNGAIDQALSENSIKLQPARKQLASKNTWTVRGKKLHELVIQLTKKDLP